MFECLSQLMDSAVSQLSREYARTLECKIFQAVKKECGGCPDFEQAAANGRIVRCRQGDDSYDEFQWKGKPMFQQRILFKGSSVKIFITDVAS